ncbi:hypothetical protein JCM10207_001456 [Rhodosporidiobolus poonsookiae]
MFARTLSFLALAAALFAPLLVSAAFSQGTIDLARDVTIQYDTKRFATTEAFCKNFRFQCVKYVGPLGTYGSHHQLDCVYDLGNGIKQTGPRIRAYCGGLAKNPDGTWPSTGSDIKDYTKPVLAKYFSSSVKVKGNPVSLKRCKQIQAADKGRSGYTCDGKYY